MKHITLKNKILLGILGLFIALIALLQLNAATVSGVYELVGPATAELNKNIDVKVNVTTVTGG